MRHAELEAAADAKDAAAVGARLEVNMKVQLHENEVTTAVAVTLT